VSLLQRCARRNLVSDFQTLREAIEVSDIHEDDYTAFDVPNALLSHRIVPPDALVALDVEAGVDVWNSLTPSPMEACPICAPVEGVKAILKACGVRPVDEVVEARPWSFDGKEWFFKFDTPPKALTGCIEWDMELKYEITIRNLGVREEGE
jgi:hypothetical protein